MLDRFFPPIGPCAFCGDEIIGARHRVMDSIAESVLAGDSIEDVAQAFDASRDAVLYAVGFAEGWKMGRKRKRRAHGYEEGVECRRKS